MAQMATRTKTTNSQSVKESRRGSSLLNRHLTNEKTTPKNKKERGQNADRKMIGQQNKDLNPVRHMGKKTAGGSHHP